MAVNLNVCKKYETNLDEMSKTVISLIDSLKENKSNDLTLINLKMLAYSLNLIDDLISQEDLEYLKKSCSLKVLKDIEQLKLLLVDEDVSNNSNFHSICFKYATLNFMFNNVSLKETLTSFNFSFPLGNSFLKDFLISRFLIPDRCKGIHKVLQTPFETWSQNVINNIDQFKKVFNLGILENLYLLEDVLKKYFNLNDLKAAYYDKLSCVGNRGKVWQVEMLVSKLFNEDVPGQVWDNALKAIGEEWSFAIIKAISNVDLKIGSENVFKTISNNQKWIEFSDYHLLNRVLEEIIKRPEFSAGSIQGDNKSFKVFVNDVFAISQVDEKAALMYTDSKLVDYLKANGFTFEEVLLSSSVLKNDYIKKIVSLSSDTISDNEFGFKM